jgi:hypothetical protein
MNQVLCLIFRIHLNVLLYELIACMVIENVYVLS